MRIFVRNLFLGMLLALVVQLIFFKLSPVYATGLLPFVASVIIVVAGFFCKRCLRIK